MSKKVRESHLGVATWFVAAVTILLGWFVGLRQLATDGWINGGGTGWLLFLALVASLAGGGAFWLQGRDHEEAAAVTFLVVAVSPTVFAYPLNLVIVVAAFVRFFRARHHRSRVTAGESPLVSPAS